MPENGTRGSPGQRPQASRSVVGMVFNRRCQLCSIAASGQEENSSSAGSASNASAGSEAKAALAEVVPEVVPEVPEVVPEVAKAVRMLVVQLPAWLLDEGSEALAVL